jgi:S-DNA-T family DNA segregation ATPase FtsK/SpoIIIE
MASKVKSVKSKAPGKVGLKAETEEKVGVKQLLKDERTHKIMGTILLLMAFLFFIAFTSYLFTWQEDQDKVFLHGYKLLLGTDAKVSNLLGTFGAFISHFFIYKGFGVASYFLCSFFFVSGSNLFFGKKIFSVRRNIKYVITGLIIVSASAAVLMNGKVFPWGGAVGNMLRDWMYKTIGEVGTLAVLAVAILVYIIWRFNPVFALPAKKVYAPVINEEATDEPVEEGETSVLPVEINKTATRGNKVKGDNGMLNIPLEVNPGLNHDLQIIERELPSVASGNLKLFEVNAAEEARLFIQDAETDIPDNIKNKEVKNTSGSALELEIKSIPELAAEQEHAAIKQTKSTGIDTPYDPILDLRDYQYAQKLRYQYSENFCNSWPNGYIV